MKHLSSALLLALALIASSCSKNDNNTVSPPASAVASDYWMPTSAGTRTILEGSSVASRDGVVVDSSGQQTTMIMLGIKKPTLDNKSAYVLHTIDNSGTSSDTTESYIVLSATSIMSYDSSLAASAASTWLQTPLTVGNSWLFRPSDTTHYRITSVTETVVTPGGTFTNCVHITQTSSDLASGAVITADVYIAKGVGLVRTHMHGTFTLLGSVIGYNSDVKLVSKSF
jgi:hypothetical protein